MNWKPRFLPPSVITVTQRMAAEDAEKLMNTTRQPSADALRLAVLLSGHTHCQSAVAFPDNPYRKVCDGCLGDAATIDRELKLKERNDVIHALRCIMDLGDMKHDIITAKNIAREALKVL